MASYILKRLLLIIPTLLGIMLLNFVIVQFAPGGPVEQLVAQLEGDGHGATASFAGGGHEVSQGSDYRGRQGLEPELIEQIKKQYGFDKPAPERFFEMVKNYATFNFGDSFYQDRSVIDLIIDKMPVSISLGLWSTLIIYLISIPLGIKKALRDGSSFDVWTSFSILALSAIPSFMIGILLIILFAGGTYWDIFPLRGIVSSNWQEMGNFELIKDYLWHMILPVFSITIGGFAVLTLLTKNSFLDEIHKQYVQVAYAKGLSEKKVLYKHVFRNAMLIIIAGFPAVLLGMLFTGSLLIEVIFSLDGLGLLGYQAVVDRDYPVFFGILYIFTLFGLIMNLLRDLAYRMVDPRIDFEARS